MHSIDEIRKEVYGLPPVEEVRAQLKAAQQNTHWTAGIVRRFKQFSVVKFILSRWYSHQPPVM